MDHLIEAVIEGIKQQFEAEVESTEIDHRAEEIEVFGKATIGGEERWFSIGVFLE